MITIKIKDIISFIIITSILTVLSCEHERIKTKTYIWLIYNEKPSGYIEYITENDKITASVYMLKEDFDGVSSVNILEEVELKDNFPVNIIISDLSSDMKTEIERTESGYYIKSTDTNGYENTIFTTKPTAIIDPAFIIPKYIPINTDGTLYQYQILNFHESQPVLNNGAVSTKGSNVREIIIDYRGITERFIYSGNNNIPEEGNDGRLILTRKPVKPDKITPLKFQSIHTVSSDVYNTDYEIRISGATIDINILNEAPQTFKGTSTDYSITGSFNTNQPPEVYDNYEYKRAVGLISSYNNQFIMSPNQLPWQIVKSTGLISYRDLLERDVEILRKKGYDARLVFGLVFDNSKSYLLPHRWLEVYIQDFGFLQVDPHPIFTNESQRIRLIVGEDVRYSDITYLAMINSIFKPVVGLPINKTLEYKLKFEKADLGTVSGLITTLGEVLAISFKTDTLWSRGEGEVKFKRGYGTGEYTFNSSNAERPIAEKTVNISSDEDVFIISPVNPMLIYQLTSAISGDETPLKVKNAVSGNIFDISIVIKGTDTIYIQGMKVDVSIYSIPQIDMDIYVDSAGGIVLIESPLCRAELTTPLPKKPEVVTPPAPEEEETETKPEEATEVLQ
jgi:hypothetical protein